MALIKLEKLSKVYYNEGNVTNAVSRVDAEFNIGEFVAITGESGSGKTTLVNVLAGLDTYEEGEMYINGKETSAFDQKDFEAYRKNYIGFIFQNYALIDSYTVLQNVEVVLSIQGVPRREIKKKAIDYLKKVGLEKHLKHRATQLSGGQKQRLSIARALAKEAKIIIADEPTGNLDSKSGEQILKLLADIAKSCLVIVVTHNYSEVEPYTTRKIRMFDGVIAEDKVYEGVDDSLCIIEDKNVSDNKKAIKFALIDFKAQPFRMVLMLIVTFFTCFMVSSLYGKYITPLSSSGMDDIADMSMYMMGPFRNGYKTRIVVNKEEGLTNDDYDAIKELGNVKNVIKNDYALEGSIYITNESEFYGGQVRSIGDINESMLIAGRMPSAKNEIVVSADYEGTIIEVGTYNQYGTSREYIVVGAVEIESINQYIFLTEEMLIDIEKETIAEDYYIQVTYEEEGDNTESFNWYRMSFSDELANNEITCIIEKDNSIEDPEKVINFVFNFEENEIVFDIEKITFIEHEYEETNVFYFDTIIMNYETFEQIISGYEKRIQYSITVDEYMNVDSVLDELNELGYDAVSPYNAQKINIGFVTFIIDFIQKVFLLGVLFIVYFLAYIVIKAIMAAKQKDYNILRAIGLNNGSIRRMTYFELLIYFAISFVTVSIIGKISIILRSNNIGNFFINSLSGTFIYYKWYDFIIAILLCGAIGLLIGNRYNNRILNKSIISAMKGDDSQ